MSAPGQGQQPEGDDKPYDERQQRSHRRSEPCANEKLADDHAVDCERERSCHHRAALQHCVVGAIAIQNNAKRCERDG